MRYKHIRTGAIIDSPSKIIGKAWKPADEEPAKKSTEDYVEEEVNLEEMTKDELINLAKEQEIEVSEKDTKPVIIGKIAKAFE